MATSIMDTKLSQLFSFPRYLRKSLLAQVLTFSLILLVWIYINGGLLPGFLHRRLPILRVGPEVNILYYFGNVQQDGSKIMWARGINSKQKLRRALDSHVHMIEGDVILRGQGTPTQTMIPVMADLPATDSDFTLSDWLAMLKTSTKGIKLDFRTIDAVEMSLQKLKTLKSELKIPIWLHADILQGPLGTSVPVDPARFIHSVKRLFPDCTLSLGWTTGHHTDLSQSGYTWDMVLDMHDLIVKHELTQPLVFSARLSMIRNSIPQLKWLCDVTHASLLVWYSSEDKTITEDLMYVAYRFPPEKAYFDLQEEFLETQLKQFRHFSKDRVSALVLEREQKMFRPAAWVKMGLYIEENSILPSSESLVLQSQAVYIVSRSKYRPTGNLQLTGRVNFLSRKTVEAEVGKTGIGIYFRSTAYADWEKISGIRCFIGVLGDVEVSGSHLRSDVKQFTKGARLTPGAVDCYRFSVSDTGREVILKVNSLQNCDTLTSVQVENSSNLVLKLTVSLPDNLPLGEHPYILKMEDKKRVAILDELVVTQTN